MMGSGTGEQVERETKRMQRMGDRIRTQGISRAKKFMKAGKVVESGGQKHRTNVANLKE